MARCPYLEYESTGFLYSQGNFYCKECGKQLTENEIKYKCKTEYGEDYKQCPVYKNS